MKLLGLAEKLDDLLQLFLRFVDTGDVFEGDLLLLRGMQAGAALTKTHRFVAAGLHLAHHKNPKGQQQNEGDGLNQNGHKVQRTRVLDLDIHLVLAQDVEDVRVVDRNQSADDAVVLGEGAAQLIARDGDALDAVLLNFVEKLAEGEGLLLRSLGLLDDGPQKNRDANQDNPKHGCLNGGTHALSLVALQSAVSNSIDVKSLSSDSGWHIIYKGLPLYVATGALRPPGQRH